MRELRRPPSNFVICAANLPRFPGNSIWTVPTVAALLQRSGARSWKRSLPKTRPVLFYSGNDAPNRIYKHSALGA
jgi:hypothetical protein